MIDGNVPYICRHCYFFDQPGCPYKFDENQIDGHLMYVLLIALFRHPFVNLLAGYHIDIDDG